MRKGKLTLKEVFQDYENPWELGRSVYKYIDCGPWVSFVLQSGDELYYDDIRNKDWKDIEPLKGLKVGSIIEGVDYETETIFVPAEPLSTLNKRFFEAITEVNNQAQEIWNETHGCNDCGEPDPETGYIHINPNCKTCGGEGAII